MRTFKAIERPAQVLGMNLMDLGLVVAFLIGMVMLLGIASAVVAIPGYLHTLVLLLTIVMFFGLRWLAKNRPPGYLLGFLSYQLVQPKRISLGPLRTPQIPFPAHVQP